MNFPHARSAWLRHFAPVRALMFGAVMVIASLSPAMPEERPLRLDDVLSLEGFDSAAISPDGRWLVFEKVRPYDQNTDYSFRTYAFGRSGHQIFVYDLLSGGEAARLSGLDASAHSYQLGFSPGGQRLAIMQYRMGRLTLGAYDMVTGAHTEFGPVPAFSRDGAHNPVWLNDAELVYAGLPEGSQPALTSVRAHTAQGLEAAWQTAWAGKIPTAREVRTGPAGLSGLQPEGALVRVDAASGASRSLAQGLYADLRLSPGGNWLSALSVTRPGQLDANDLAVGDRRIYRLVVFDLTTDTPRPLAAGLEFAPYTISWAPDGHQLAAFGWPEGGDPRDGRFHIVDVVTGEVKAVSHKGLDLASEAERGFLQRPERVVFLGDDELAVFARALPPSGDQTGQFTYKDIGPVDLSPAHWYRIGAGDKPVNLTAGLTDVSAIPVHDGQGRLTILAREGVFSLAPLVRLSLLAPAAQEKLVQRLEGNFAARAGVMRPYYAEQALFRVERDGASAAVMIGLGGSADAPSIHLNPKGDGFDLLAGSIRSGVILYRSETGPVSELRLFQAGADTKDIVLSRINRHLENVTLGDWRTVRYRVPSPEGRMGTELEACVLLPPDYNPDAPPPLIVDLYPDVPSGCRSRAARMTHPDPQSPYLWAAEGFAYVRLPAPRRLIWQEDAPIGGMPSLAEAGAAAIVAAGFADPGCLVLHGFSQGGVSALYVAAHSDKFAAVIAKNSWADFFSHYFGTVGVNSILYDRFGSFERYDTVAGSDFGIGKTPFEAPDVYYRNSPVFLAPRIDMPVMLIHSDLDSFSVSQFDEMFGALDRAGKDARYVRYFGEGHAPSSPANIRDMWARQKDFLASVGVTP